MLEETYHPARVFEGRPRVGTVTVVPEHGLFVAVRQLGQVIHYRVLRAHVVSALKKMKIKRFTVEEFYYNIYYTYMYTGTTGISYYIVRNDIVLET